MTTHNAKKPAAKRQARKIRNTRKPPFNAKRLAKEMEEEAQKLLNAAEILRKVKA